MSGQSQTTFSRLLTAGGESTTPLVRVPVERRRARPELTLQDLPRASAADGRDLLRLPRPLSTRCTRPCSARTESTARPAR